MTQLQPLKPAPKSQQTGQSSSLASALAEMEKAGAQGSTTGSGSGSGLDAFREALRQSRAGDGSSKATAGVGDMQNEDYFERQQKEALKQQQREALRKKLHDQVNPVETQALFDAREKQIKEQIDGLRYELRMLSQEVKEFNKEIDLTLQSNVASPGQTGNYYLNFFHQLRAFIMLLRQKIKSAQTWVHAANGKRNKQGMVIQGQQHQKTQTVQDMMHHERSSSYAGA